MRVLRIAMVAAVAVTAFVAFGAGTAAAAVTPAFSATDVATCNGSATITVSVTAQNPPPEQQAADIVLLVDDSGSIGASAFITQVRPALNSFIAAAAPSPAGNHIGIIEFGTGTNNVTGGLISDAATLTSAVSAMPYRAGFTHTLTGLRAADSMLTGASGRAGVPKVVIVVTDGVWNPASEDPTAFAAALAAGGTAIWVVGVGSGVNASQLAAITGGYADRVFAIADFDDLEAALSNALLEVVPAATNVRYQATAAPGWIVTGSSAGTITGNSVDWTVPQINSATPTTLTLTYTQQHVGTTGGEVPLSSTAALTYVDDANVAQSVDYSSATVTVSGCNRAPTADAGPDQTISLSGSPTAAVSMDASASSDPDGDTLTYEWSEGATPLGSGVNPTVSLGLGVHAITLTVSDGEYSSTDTMTVSVVDPSPPTITPNVSGTLGSGGWYTSNVGVSFDVVDLESPATPSAGCAGGSVTTDTAGASFSCSATSAGGSAGPVSVTVKRDATAPSVVFGGNAGTYGVDDTVTITCTASDAMSGLATPANCGGVNAPAWSLGAGPHTITRTAADNAGNTSTMSTTYTVVTDAAGICALIRQWSDNAGVANSLCVKLSHGTMTAFGNELAAQRGKHIPADKADIIRGLAAGL